MLKSLRKFLGRSPSAAQALADPVLVKAVKKARLEGRSYRDIERMFKLRAAGGKTAHRLCES